MVEVRDELTSSAIKDIINQLAAYVGLDSGFVVMLIFFFIAAAIFLFIYLKSGSILLSSLSITGLALVGAITQLVPIWLFALFCITFITLIFFFDTQGDSDKQLEAAANSDEDGWAIYGDRLKNAYTAKFGGRNTGFDSEVDQRIVVMKNIRNGFTRTIARDWLKRMERFTESKFKH